VGSASACGRFFLRLFAFRCVVCALVVGGDVADLAVAPLVAAREVAEHVFQRLRIAAELEERPPLLHDESEEIAAKVAVKPEQVTDFYAKNPDQFKEGESVRASHILIAVPKGADAAAKALARTKAEGILTDVKAGKDFAALAKQHSADPGSAANGGDLGFFQQGQMVGPFNDAAFSLAPGATSDLVETDFGFHIIRVAEKKEGRTIPLEEVKPQVEQYLEQKNRQEQTEAFVNSLKAKGKIEVLI